MTEQQKIHIKAMREDGAGYSAIADALDIPKNTVKSFCQRNGLGAKKPEESRCLNCGKAITQTPHKRIRKFCSDSCRMRWWNSHRDEGDKTRYERVCPTCGRTFVAAEKRTKYCSMGCYRKGGKKNA